MIFGHEYYHGTTRRYIIMFGNIFNDMKVNRFASNGDVRQTLNVPLAYGPKNKQVERVLADPDFGKAVSTTLPRMSFHMEGMGYNPLRKLNSAHKFIGAYGTDTKTFAKTYVPTPYDFSFKLSILTKNVEDGTQLIEQILPFFTPDFTVAMKVLPLMDIVLDIPIELGNITSDDSYDGSYDDNRIISWDLDFTVKGYLFGPITNAKYITKADVAYFEYDGSLPDAAFTYTGDASFNTTETSE
jgi:hypothetical protein